MLLNHRHVSDVAEVESDMERRAPFCHNLPLGRCWKQVVKRAAAGEREIYRNFGDYTTEKCVVLESSHLYMS